MRHRLAIGAIAVMIIGVAAFLWEPARAKPGTVEYHKQYYFKAWNYDTVDDVLAWVPFVGRALYAKKEEQRDIQFQALTNLGYLSIEVFAVSNRSATEIGRELTDYMWREQKDVANEVHAYSLVYPTNIQITGPAKFMRKWGDYIRSIDVVKTN